LNLGHSVIGRGAGCRFSSVPAPITSSCGPPAPKTPNVSPKRGFASPHPHSARWGKQPDRWHKQTHSRQEWGEAGTGGLVGGVWRSLPASKHARVPGRADGLRPLAQQTGEWTAAPSPPCSRPSSARRKRRRRRKPGERRRRAPSGWAAAARANSVQNAGAASRKRS
jgi:hypothetical protein